MRAQRLVAVFFEVLCVTFFACGGDSSRSATDIPSEDSANDSAAGDVDDAAENDAADATDEQDAPSDITSTDDGTPTDPTETGPPPVSALPEVESTMALDWRGGAAVIRDPESPLFGASVTVFPTTVVIDPFTGEPAPLITIGEGDTGAYLGDTELGLGEVPQFGLDLILELLPDEAYTVHGFAPHVVYPLPPGVSSRGLTLTPFDEIPNQLIRTWADPINELGPRFTFDTAHFGPARPIYLFNGFVGIVNAHASATFYGTVSAYDYFTDNLTVPGTDETISYTPLPLPNIDLQLDPGESQTLALFNGLYLVEGTFEGETSSRCQTVVARHNDSNIYSYMFREATAICLKAEVSLEASPATVAPGETVTLTATIAGTPERLVHYYWDITGGQLDGPRDGHIANSNIVTATFTAPEEAGPVFVYIAARWAGVQMGADIIMIDVTSDNTPPIIESLTATPFFVGPGPTVGRAIAEEGAPGVARLEVNASDADGDELWVFWQHTSPTEHFGSFHDIETGAALLRGPDTDGNEARIVWPGTLEPYTEPALLFMAPPEVEGWADCMNEPCETVLLDEVWITMNAVVSDGTDWDESWALLGVSLDDEPVLPPDVDPEPVPDMGVDDADAGNDDADTEPTDVDTEPPAVEGDLPSDADAPITADDIRRCEIGAAICYNYIGSAYITDPGAAADVCSFYTSGVLGEGPCDTSDAIGACFTFRDDPYEQMTVYYGEASTASARQAECEATVPNAGGPGVWQQPYVPPG